MAELTGTIVGSAYGRTTLSAYSTTAQAVAGYSGSAHYAYILKFKAPAFSGLSTAAKFVMYMNNQLGQDTAKLRYAICTSDSNATSYMGTTVAVSDSNQVATGTISVTGLSSTMEKQTLTIDTTALETGKTYYLILWSYNTTGVSIAATNGVWGDFTITLAYVAKYALSISQGTGSTITVKRTSSPSGSTGTLSNGAAIYAGDVLTITFGASTGYNLSTHTVNGSTFTSGGSHTVTGAVAVVSTASLKTFKLSISAGTGSTITVKRGSTTLTNGATITYGDVLTITFGASTGYNLSTHTVNGSTFTSGGSHTVTGAVAVVSTASLKTFKLSISAGTGSTITVKKGSTTLTNGATIAYGDVLTITFGASTGYNLSTHTVNGSEFTSGDTHTVTGAVAVVSTANVKSFTLTITAGTGSTITVKRTKSPLKGAGTGQLTDGAKIYYNDVLAISFAGSALYEILTGTVNGTDFESGGTHTVTGAVVVVTTTRMLGFVYLTDGGVVRKFRVIIHHNGSWRKYRPRILHSDEDISAFGVGDTIIVTTSLPVTTEGSTIIIGGA